MRKACLSRRAVTKVERAVFFGLIMVIVIFAWSVLRPSKNNQKHEEVPAKQVVGDFQDVMNEAEGRGGISSSFNKFVESKHLGEGIYIIEETPISDWKDWWPKVLEELEKLNLKVTIVYEDNQIVIIITEVNEVSVDLESIKEIRKKVEELGKKVKAVKLELGIEEVENE